MGSSGYDVSETDPAWIFYTSGTTGRPKGATLTHRTLLAMTLRYYADVDQPSPEDSYFHTAPMSHADGLYAIPHLIKASHHVVPESGGFNVEELFGLLETYKNATFMVRALYYSDFRTGRIPEYRYQPQQGFAR